MNVFKLNKCSKLWELYHLSRNILDRDNLIEEYLYLVKVVTLRLMTNFPSHIKMEDLYSSGVSGLIKAIEKYDPLKGKRFESYAMFIIKANIIDELRAQDWIPRSVYQKANKISNAMETLRLELGRNPTDLEISSYLNISKEEFFEWIANSRPAIFVPLNDSESNSSLEGDSYALSEKIPDSKAFTGFDIANQNEYAKILQQAIQNLSEQERKVLILYYYEENILKDIGKILGLSESRVSQIHSKAILKLRGLLFKLLKENE